MNRFLFGVSIFGFGMALAGFAPAARADVDIDIDVFYHELAPYGDWVEHERYGWTWIPATVGYGWRPYTDGNWVFNDEFGWMWVSNHEWGWAAFHYGRWTFDPRYGWLWVPGTQWAPAWVTWRSGGGHIGWAPLPPEAHWRAEVGLDLGGLDLSFAIDQTAWSFVDERVFVEPNVYRYIVPPARNVTIIPRTFTTTRYVPIGRYVGNFGVDVRRIETVSAGRVKRVRVRDADPVRVRREGTRVLGDEVVVYRPRVRQDRVNVTPRTLNLERRRVVREGDDDRDRGPRQIDDRERVRRLEERFDADRRVLQDAQERDRRQAERSRAVPREELERRHAEERRVLDEQQRRNRAVIDKSERGAPQPQRRTPDARERPAPRERGPEADRAQERKSPPERQGESEERTKQKKTRTEKD